MINQNYSYSKRNNLKLSKLLEIDHEDVCEFYISADSTLKNSLESALNKLKKKSLVSWNIVKTICLIQSTLKTNETGQHVISKHFRGYDEDNEEQYEFEVVNKVRHIHRQATQEEDRLIIRTERELLKEMNMKDKQEVVKFGKWDIFSKKVKERLFDLANILYYYESYMIVFNNDHVNEELEYLERTFQQKLLNNAVKEKLLKNAENRHIKSWSEMESKHHERRSKENYVVNQKKYILHIKQSFIIIQSKGVVRLGKRLSGTWIQKQKGLFRVTVR